MNIFKRMPNRHALALAALFMAVTSPQAGPIFSALPNNNAETLSKGTLDYLETSPHLDFKFATNPRKQQLELVGRIHIQQTQKTLGVFKTSDGNISTIDCSGLSKILTYTLLSKIKAENENDQNGTTKYGVLYEDVRHGIDKLECPVLSI
ncbi:MAG: hypothetical protein RBR86_08860 [Pseudobdellovibrionaceae bacterium]|jgi:hypothetical protein|nr:hypothetical protein [Pseudobdellovibrionaceae bacterium]